MKFGENLAFIRKSRHITQDTLATYLGVSRSTIAGYETRDREPEYHALVKIADYFQVTTDYLLGHETDQTIPMEANCMNGICCYNPQNLSSEQEHMIREMIPVMTKMSNRDLAIIAGLVKTMKKLQ